MRVASAFRRAGFRVTQSDYYSDPNTKNQREIDVVAYIDYRIKHKIIRVQFMIECKLSRNKPWLMFCSSETRLATPARVAQRTASPMISRALSELAHLKEIQDLALFQITEPPAYGATQAFTTGSDVVYAALTAVGSAVTSEAKEESQHVHSILFPVVVIEGKLFSCVLNEDASIATTECSRGTLLWRNPIAGKPHTIVSILSDACLQDFANESAKSIHEFFPISSSCLEKWLKPTLIRGSKLIK